MKPSRYLRRLAAAFLICLCGMLLAACVWAPPVLPAASQTPVSSPAGTPSPTPSPSPAPYIAVFGSRASKAFENGISAAAKTGKYTVTFESGTLEQLSSYQPAGRCAAIVLLQGQENSLPETSFPIYVFAAEGQQIPKEIPHLIYTGAYTPKIALSLAVGYPPHETPVRLIGLFTGTESLAYPVWREAAESGRVFAKAEFFLTQPAPEVTPEPKKDSPSPTPIPALDTRLLELFSGFYPGMIDGIFAETGELAVAAASALASLGRDDIEVFAASTSANAQILLSPLLVACVGVDFEEAGGLCYSAASALLEGKTIDPVVVQPQTFSYAPVS